MEQDWNILAAEADVERIITEDMEKKESMAYLEAVSFIPNRVHQETPMRSFLRTEDYDASKAAKRLALYWKLRKLIFQERWLLPMNQTGTGALTPDQVAIFRTGYMHILNSATAGPVILIDHSILPQGVSHFQPHISMYFITVVTNEYMQTNGLTFLFSVHSRDQSIMLPQFDLAQQLTAALPTKIKKIVVAQAYEYGKECLLDYLGFQKEKVTQMELGKQSPCIRADSFAGTLQKLQQNGFDRDSLPLEFGGNLNVRSHFDEWIRMRIHLEEIMASAPPIRNSEMANLYNNRCATTHRPTTAIVPALGFSPKTAANTSTTLHASCKTLVPVTTKRNQKLDTRQKENLRLTQLQKEKKDLLKQQEALRQESRRLEAALSTARLLVAVKNVITTSANESRRSSN